MKDATNWLLGYLKEHGMTDCETVREAAKLAGYSRAELRAAKLNSPVKSRSFVFWLLPEDEK